MNTPRTCCLFALVLLLALAAGGWAAQAEVELKNSEAMAVLVHLGTRDGVSDETDFAITDAQGNLLARIYPFELYDDRFWSQPLDKKTFAAVQPGMIAATTVVEREVHWEMRYRGQAWQTVRERENLRKLQVELERVYETSDHLRQQLQSVVDVVSDAQEVLAASDDTAMETRDRIEELTEERQDLYDKREKMLQKETSQSRLQRVERDIQKINEKIQDEQEKLRDADNQGWSRVTCTRNFTELADELYNSLIDAETLTQHSWEALGVVELLRARRNAAHP